MTKRVFVLVRLLLPLLLLTLSTAEAQTEKSRPRIGWVWFEAPAIGQLPSLESVLARADRVIR